jgi:beta-glucosidase
MTSRLMILLLALASLWMLGSTAMCQPALQDDPRVTRLLSQLTLEEKIELLGGTGFDTKPIPRLGIPPLPMTDGPVGVHRGLSTAFPAGVMMAATWDPALIERLGAAVGREAKSKGLRMLLGPCVNIHRTPFGGRNFESFGEDPYLAARMAVAVVKGVQSEKVIATTKHYACNNQEHERLFTNVTVSERALREIYLPAFEAAVKEGGSLSVMSAYNKVNGLWCSENPYLLTDILKKEWGFKGFIVSDWGAVHSTVPTANAGLDVEMPTAKYLNADSLLPAIKAGKISVATIDDKVRRLLNTMAWAGLLDSSSVDKGALGTPEHLAIARDVAAEGIVLLKNDRNVLPLDAGKLRSIAVVGPNAAYARTGGGGSSHVDPMRTISVLDAVKSRLGDRVRIAYAPGCPSVGVFEPIPAAQLVPPNAKPGEHGLKGEYFANVNLEGAPALTRIDSMLNYDWETRAPAEGLPNDGFSVRWTGQLIAPATGTFALSTMSDDGVRVYVEDKLVIDDWNNHSPEQNTCEVVLEAGKKYRIRVEFFDSRGGALLRLGLGDSQEKYRETAIAAARDADAVLVCVGSNETTESEGFDRRQVGLSEEQERLVAAIAAVNRKTIVVVNTGAGVLTERWINSVPALLEAWFPGQEGGTAIADVAFGDVNPSGKLPTTFVKRWEDSPAFGNFPGKGSVDYAEGIYVGYRYFDTKKIDVAFPFGFGLSYTTFAISNLKVMPADYPGHMRFMVSAEIENTGTKPGAEVVQLYVHSVSAPVDRPEKELKGFRRIALAPGEKKSVQFMLDDRSFAYYDAARKGWVVAPGQYEIQIGNSSRNITMHTSVKVATP